MDNHEGSRNILCSVLAHAHFDVCGEAENGKQAIAKAAELLPDVVVIDFMMPVMNGIEAAPQIRKIAPGVKIILISGILPSQLASEAARLAGAEAYVEKSKAVIDLAPAIRTALERNG